MYICINMYVYMYMQDPNERAAAQELENTFLKYDFDNSGDLDKVFRFFLDFLKKNIRRH